MKKKYLLLTGLSFLINLNSFIIAQNCNLVIDENFNNHQGTFKEYNLASAISDFNGVNSRAAADYRGLNTPGKKWPQLNTAGEGVLRADYLPNSAGAPNGGFLFDKTIPNTEEAVMEYKVKFGPNFVWAAGGKLPGLGGTSLTKGGGIPLGCTENQNSIDNGFSARLMWRKNGKLVVYTYLPDRTSNCGVDLEFFTVDANKWYTVREHLKLNTPGKKDGLIEMFVDGKLVFKKTDVLFRKAGKEAVKINSAIFHTYRGGSDSDVRFHSSKRENVFFDDFKVWVNCANPGNVNSNPCDGNTIPVVSLSAPTNNASFNSGTNVTISANASDNGSISKVEFFRGTTLIGTDNTSPYSIILNSLPVGTHSITSKAFDNCNASKTSVAVNITIKTSSTDPCAGKAAPTVAFTAPANNSNFNVGQAITFNATASSPVLLTKVEFLNGSTVLGSDNTAPYSFSTSALAAGSYSITTKAYDNCNRTSTSSAVNVKINTVVTNIDPVLGPNCGASGKSISFEINAANRVNATSYSWWFSGASQSVTPSASGTSCIVIPNQYFTSGSVCVGVHLNKAPYYVQYCKAIVKCNARFGEEEFEEISSLEEMVSIYPNPAQNQENIIVNSPNNISAPLKIQFLNTLGEIVLETTNTDYQTTMATTSLTNGMYLVKLIFEGNSITKQLVIFK